MCVCKKKKKREKEGVKRDGGGGIERSKGVSFFGGVDRKNGNIIIKPRRPSYCTAQLEWKTAAEGKAHSLDGSVEAARERVVVGVGVVEIARAPGEEVGGAGGGGRNGVQDSNMYRFSFLFI
jgi:hypothetical protein